MEVEWDSLLYSDILENKVSSRFTHGSCGSDMIPTGELKSILPIWTFPVVVARGPLVREEGGVLGVVCDVEGIWTVSGVGFDDLQD
jgi:hypothetical protein